MRKVLSVVAGVLAAAAALPALAHHSFAAEFDAAKPVKLEGVVTKMEWINPHSWIHLDVTTPSGEVQHWMVEGGAPNALLRRGWNRNSLPPARRSRCRASRRRTARCARTAATSRSRTARSCSSVRRAPARRTSGRSNRASRLARDAESSEA